MSAELIAKSWIEEVGWLLVSYLLAFILTGLLVGFRQVWESGLDIQMHNTYFVFGPLAAALPLFVPIATGLTLVRAGRGRFRRIGANLVLGLLALSWLLIGFLLRQAH